MKLFYGIIVLLQEKDKMPIKNISEKKMMINFSFAND